MEVNHKQLVAGGTLVGYRVLGAERKGTPLVFLHGWRSSSEAWAPLLPYLEKLGTPLYFLDFPGFGRSETPRQPFALDDYVRVAREWMKKLGIKRPVIVGHSFGGRVAIKLAAGTPDAVRALVLTGSAGLRTVTVGMKIKNVVARIAKPFFAPRFMQSLRHKIYQAIGAEDYVATPELRETFLCVIGEDLSLILPSIAAPTLLIWGEQDTETPLAAGERMHRLIPQSKLAVIPGAGHFAFVDRPEEFARILTDFLVKRSLIPNP